MATSALNDRESTDTNRWLKSYYLLRGVVSLLWVGAAVTVGTQSPMVAGALLLVYPAWDAVANLVDAHHNGGVRRSPSQTVNAVVSTLTTVGVAVALTHGLHAVLGVFGVWAALSGLLQLVTAVRRWKHAGAQWLMIVSGVQSAAAGAMFLRLVDAADTPGVADIAPYAAFGAFYFLASALWLAVGAKRAARARLRR